MQCRPPSYWLQITQQHAFSWHTDYRWFARYWPTLGYPWQGWRPDLGNHLWNTAPGSSTNDDQDSLGAAALAHECCFLPAIFSMLVFPFPSICCRRPLMKPPHLRAEGWRLSPTGPSKTVPADGAFTSCLAIYTFLWRVTIKHLLLSEIPTHRRDACCVHPIQWSTLENIEHLKLAALWIPKGSGRVSSDRQKQFIANGLGDNRDEYFLRNYFNLSVLTVFHHLVLCHKAWREIKEGHSSFTSSY